MRTTSNLGSLKLVAPKNVKHKYLTEEGLVVPAELDEDEAVVPLDFTTISNKAVGQQHSYWAVRHGHIMYQLARRKEILIKTRHDLRMAEAKWRFLNEKKYKAKWEANDAMLQDEEIEKLNMEIVNLEAQIAMYEALMGSYEDFRNAASRELSRRFNEKAPND